MAPTRRSGKRSVFREGNGPLFGLLVPPDWPFFWNGYYGWFCSVLKAIFASYFKIWHSNFSYRTRRFEIIHWFNHLHFFDPQHSFRRKLWASTYLSLESYLPTRERCWCGEFVKTRIWNLQSLLVCPIILWQSSLTRDDWISGRRSWLASRIQSWCLAFTHHMWWCVFCHIRDPRIGLLRIRCWRRRRWICKNVSRCTMRVPNTWRPNVAARHSQRTA